jgi:hypothetical protein
MKPIYMFRKDYIMMLIQTLMDAIQDIVNCIEKGDVGESRKQLDESYELLGNDAAFFMGNTIEVIIYFFQTKGCDSLKRTEMLAQMLLLEAVTEENSLHKNELL